MGGPPQQQYGRPSVAAPWAALCGRPMGGPPQQQYGRPSAAAPWAALRGRPER